MSINKLKQATLKIYVFHFFLKVFSLGFLLNSNGKLAAVP